MSVKPLFLLALLAGCAKGPAADLQYIKQARSIAAEWALINQQSEQHKLTRRYVDSMRQWLRDGLSTSRSSLVRPDSAYGREISALLAEPPGASSAKLRTHAEALRRIEDALESA